MEQKRNGLSGAENGQIALRLAGPDDAAAAAKIIREVSEGIVDYLFSSVPGLSPEAILQLAFGKSIGPYSLENVLLLMVGETTAGLVFAYDAERNEIPVLMETFLSKEKLDAVRPLLTARRDKAYWVNTFWVAPEFRGRGLSELLMSLVQDLALDKGFEEIALHCWTDNSRALRFYEKNGFSRAGTIPTGGKLLESHPEGGILLVKPIRRSNNDC